MDINMYLMRKKWDLVDLPYDLTTSQKAAIICSLIIISKSDNNIHENETKVVEAVMLRINLDPYDQTLISFLQNGDNQRLFSALSSLSESNKEWFVLFVYLVMIADGKIQFAETANLEVLCTATNISEKDYYSIVEKYLDNCTDFEDVYKALFY